MFFGSISCNNAMANGLSLSLGWGMVNCLDLCFNWLNNRISMSINRELYAFIPLLLSVLLPDLPCALFSGLCLPSFFSISRHFCSSSSGPKVVSSRTAWFKKTALFLQNPKALFLLRQKGLRFFPGRPILGRPAPVGPLCYPGCYPTKGMWYA